MTHDEILKLFREEAALLGAEPENQNDLILRLAQLLADSKGRLPKENFDELVHIGAVLYQKGLGQYNARADVAEIMRSSLEDQEKQ